MRAGLGEGRRRTVHIEGQHHLTAPLVLDDRDSGTAAAPVTWRSSAAAPGRLSGGRLLPASAFEPAAVPSGAAGVLKAELFAHGLEEGSIPGLSWPYANGAIELFGTAKTRGFCCVNCSC